MEPTVNEIYRVKHTSGMIRWRYIRWYWGGTTKRQTKCYIGVNLDTGREIRLKSTRKIKGPDNA